MNTLDNSLRTALITGGSGYVGSITAHELLNLGFRIIIIDEKPLPLPLQTHKNIYFFQGDYADPLIWQNITTQFSCKALIHLASYIEVGESVIHPARYYHNNVAATIKMLELARKAGVSTIIAASSSAVYGNPLILPIPEEHQRVPLSPYARTKTILEDILRDYHNAYHINVALLRFANVAGALPAYGLGECHDPETHLIPRLIQASYTNKSFMVHGNDYPTPDGTCIRDFVHVHDIARLHGSLLNLFYTRNISSPITLNVGSGRGTSVKEVIEMVGLILNKKITIEEKSRRPGDAPAIVLDISLASELVGWKPLSSDLVTIITSAYQFYKAQLPLSTARGRSCIL